jgi:two-component system, LytTR family, response regulator
LKFHLKMVINCIIVEDEPLALKRTKEFVNQVSYLNLMASFTNAIDAIGFLKKNAIDLIFLDIEMDGFTGIEFIESLSFNPQIIITTAYDKYALKGFELNVTDYLLKPFRFDRFLTAVERVYNIISKDKKEDKNFIFVKTEYRLERIALYEIFFIEGMGDYRNVQTVNKKILTLKTFSDFEIELPANKFCRVHKSYIIALDKIISIEHNRVKIKDTLIPISDSYKGRFFNLIGIKST